MRPLRFLLISFVSFITIAVGTILIPGSFLNRVILFASCGIFSLNSAFCTPNLEINPDRVMAFDSFNTIEEGHRGITLEALNGDTLEQRGGSSKLIGGWVFPTNGRIPIKDPINGDNLNFTGTAKTEIERAVRHVDLKEEYLDTQEPSVSLVRPLLAGDLFSPDFSLSYKHFDRETFPEGSQWLIDLKKRINTNLAQITDGNSSLQQQHATEARRLLGLALHTLQDFYAHSNWVELGKTNINEDLGRVRICDAPSEHTPPCSRRPQTNSPEDLGEPTAVRTSICSTGACTERYDQGKLAPNLNKLTSGYYMGNGPIASCTAPTGKVRHGLSIAGCPEGLNKDSHDRPHYAEAANLAEQASRDYIHQIIDPLADSGKFKAIKALMGMSTQPTQIDLTGTWIESGSVATIDNRGCTSGYAGNFAVDGQDPQHRVFALRQSGNQLTFPSVATTWGSGSGTQSYQGTVSGNRVTYIISGNAGGGFTSQYTGIISDDGNRVSGEGICRGNRGSATANVTFAWVRQVASQANVSLAGTWQSDWGPVVFNSNLTGYWKQGGGTGQIQSGTYDPQTRRLVFRYYQPWNGMNGNATLTLSQDGNQLSGTWTQQRGANPPSSGGSGTWTMRHNRSQ